MIGASDDFGYKALEQPISYHDLHATMLHLLGLDHKKLTYRFNGRDMRLTDVYGTLIPQIVNALMRPRALPTAVAVATCGSQRRFDSSADVMPADIRQRPIGHRRAA